VTRHTTEPGNGLRSLAGLRVIDMSTVVAGPGAARHLADYGADVIKVERPGGDSTRDMGWKLSADDDSLFWKILNRGKRCVTLDLKKAEDSSFLLTLAREADVLIENMRPGRLEKLGLGPDVLHENNPRLVVLRVSGFGQDGPYAELPGFATNAEAMSGFAGLLGESGGPPLLPPIALTDEVTALVGAFAAVMGVRNADQTGRGQVIDVNLLDSMIQLMGPLPSAYVHLGYLQPRLGAGLPYSVPRGTYQCGDGVWIALSASAESVAGRVLEVCGLKDDERFANFQLRSVNRSALEAAITEWVSSRESVDVIATFRSADAAVSLVYTMDQVVEDPHVRERQCFIEVDGVTMPRPVVRFATEQDTFGSPGPPLADEGVRVEWLPRRSIHE
jgi:crotonobetainyl-CoA:carnitine CoA-transferase CaiB-like acyl-CoA transferase